MLRFLFHLVFPPSPKCSLCLWIFPFFFSLRFFGKDFSPDHHHFQCVSETADSFIQSVSHSIHWIYNSNDWSVHPHTSILDFFRLFEISSVIFSHIPNTICILQFNPSLIDPSIHPFYSPPLLFKIRFSKKKKRFSYFFFSTMLPIERWEMLVARLTLGQYEFSVYLYGGGGLFFIFSTIAARISACPFCPVLST